MGRARLMHTTPMHCRFLHYYKNAYSSGIMSSGNENKTIIFFKSAKSALKDFFLNMLSSMQSMRGTRDQGTVENTTLTIFLSFVFGWIFVVCGIFENIFIWKSIPFRNYCFSIFPLPQCIRKARFHTFSFNQYNSTFTEDHMHKMFQNAFQK